MQDLKDKVAFVTGGASGIGLGIAKAMVAAGMRVVIADVREDHLKDARAWFLSRKQSRRIRCVKLDVTNRKAYARAADAAEKAFGKIHVLVNNAGLGLLGAIDKTRYDDWDWGLDVMIGGVVNGLLTVLPRIRAHGEGGHIVNTSSMAGLMPIVAGLYSMTKAAVIGLSEALHIELKPEGIGVSAYCPGPVHSNIASAVKNRPQQYGESGYTPPPDGFAEWSKTQPYMSAEEAGERVLQGIRRGDLFILTHPEFKAGVVDRHRTIEDAFPDEPIDEVRAAAIPFLTASPVYAPENRLPAPTRPSSLSHR